MIRVVVSSLIVVGTFITFAILLRSASSPIASFLSSHATTQYAKKEAPEAYRHDQVQSRKLVRQHTATSPWGIAVDNVNGFIWVAEANCDMHPACDTNAAFPSLIAKYAQVDGRLLAEYYQ